MSCGLQAHWPPMQPNEQHSSSLLQAAPTAWQPGFGRCEQLQAAHRRSDAARACSFMVGFQSVSRAPVTNW